jgi:hypothetical protein
MSTEERNKREECEHPEVRFASGDYYVMCTFCDARWVCCGADSDQPRPDLANQGVGTGLSGGLRFE